ncbi:MAG: FecR domain-containing protein [Planctomycetota bacterium]|jgi:ferric-dicitrate binding protein FerR (iron transport regulator)
MSTNQNWEELIERHLRGELTEPEMEQLAERLDTDPETRQLFVEEAVWDTRMAEMLRGVPPDETHERLSVHAYSDLEQQKSTNTLLRVILAGAIAVIVVLSVGLYQQRAQAERRIAEIQANSPEARPEPSIAKVVGLSGSLIWTGDRGMIQRELEVGTKLAGGTIEGIAPDSWFELQFKDGSTVMISGTSILTFADAGQKVLRLKEGSLSARVEPQPDSKPMLVHTHTALLEVLGTRFKVEADLASTALNVSEGKVRVTRLSDNSKVDVPAKHRLIAEADNELVAVSAPESVSQWNSELHRKPDSYGKWQSPTNGRPASLKAIPLIPPSAPHITLYLAGLSVDRADDSPVVVQPGSRFIVRGRLQKEAQVHFGIRVSHPSGEMAGMFRGDLHKKQPLAKIDTDGHFEEVYHLERFSIDPAVYDRKDELASKPEGLILDDVWAFTHTDSPTGLEILEIVLIPPSDSLIPL